MEIGSINDEGECSCDGSCEGSEEECTCECDERGRKIVVSKTSFRIQLELRIASANSVSAPDFCSSQAKKHPLLVDRDAPPDDNPKGYKRSRKIPLTLLVLPQEILTQIIINLSGREAIYLSLTCRYLYFDLMSRFNSYLWYHIGPFSNSMGPNMPGLRAAWRLMETLPRLPKLNVRASSQDQTSAVVRNTNTHVNSTKKYPPPIGTVIHNYLVGEACDKDRNQCYYWHELVSTSTHPIIPKTDYKMRRVLMLGNQSVGYNHQAFKRRRMCDRKLYEYFKEYKPRNGKWRIDGLLDYRRILSETMLGSADIHDACQWCLQEPRLARRYSRWNIWLCDVCAQANMISKSNIKSVDIDLTKLHTCTVWDPYLQCMMPDMLWKPQVRRLLTARYGAEQAERILECSPHRPWI